MKEEEGEEVFSLPPCAPQKVAPPIPLSHHLKKP